MKSLIRSTIISIITSQLVLQEPSASQLHWASLFNGIASSLFLSQSIDSQNNGLAAWRSEQIALISPKSLEPVHR